MSEDKKIEVVKGDGSNLDISPAYDHLNDVTPEPSSKKPKNKSNMEIDGFSLFAYAYFK